MLVDPNEAYRHISACCPQVRAYLSPERAIWSYSGELYKVISAILFSVRLHVLKERKMPWGR